MDNQKYYENFNWGTANLSSKLISKIKLIIEKIPDNVDNIIDIGCGDGTISSALNEKYDVLAVDRSKNALKEVNAKTLLASADNIPVESQSYDMVFSSEMIEHLPDDIFEGAIKEMKRISRKHIFLTFPNDENINKNHVECTHCNFIFNKSYHLRSLNKEKIESIFSDYIVKDTISWELK